MKSSIPINTSSNENKISTNGELVNENKNNSNENNNMEGIETNIDNITDDEHANKRRKSNNSTKIVTETDNDNNNNVSQRRSLRNKNKNRNNSDDDDDDDEEEEEEEGYIYSDELIINKEYIKKLETDIKFRMRLAKMRVTPNAHSQVQQYNSQSIPEIIPDHNDPYKIEWTTTENHEKYFVGLKVIYIIKCY